MKKVHLFSGISILIFFAITGHYMKYYLELPESDFTVQRMMFRASHMYLLFAGAINTVLGCYWSEMQGRYIRWVQYFGSVLIVLAQLLLVVAFITEPEVVSKERTYTYLGCVFLLAGVVITLITSLIVGYKENIRAGV